MKPSRGRAPATWIWSCSTRLTENRHLAEAEAVSKALNFADIVLAYGKLAAAQAAFNIEFEMEGGTPLVRTQKQWPQTGEKRTIVATLSMDMGNNQWGNCFRMFFNQMGLDFTMENDGPIEDASVSWSGETGFGGQLVQYVGDAGSRIQNQGGGTSSPILDARTDSSGRARVDVEGVGQRQDLKGDPKPVMKEAKAVAMAVIKPANMYRDIKHVAALAAEGSRSGRGGRSLLRRPTPWHSRPSSRR